MEKQDTAQKLLQSLASVQQRSKPRKFKRFAASTDQYKTLYWQLEEILEQARHKGFPSKITEPLRQLLETMLEDMSESISLDDLYEDGWERSQDSILERQEWEALEGPEDYRDYGDHDF